MGGRDFSAPFFCVIRSEREDGVPPTYYDILDIPPSASADQIRVAYRRQAQRWHPDRNGGEHHQFVLIQEAYATLSEASLRWAYDNALFVPDDEPEQYEPPAPAEQPPTPGEPLHLLARVRIRDLYQEGAMRLKGWVGHVCGVCGGRGCGVCGMAGQTLRKRTWQVTRPARWRPNEWLRLAHAGHRGPFAPLPGDVFIEANPLPSYGWHWERHRQRLEKAVRVPQHVLREGGSLRIQAPWGDWIQVTVAPHLGAAAWVRVLGLGLGPLSSPDHAWLYIHVGFRFSWPYRRLPSV